MLQGDAIREITLEGPGAGGIETASAVVADITSVIGTMHTGFLQNDAAWRSLPMLPPGDNRSPFYFRLSVKDRPGALAQVAEELAQREISIARLLQHQNGDGASLHVVTHQARAGALDDALAALGDLLGRAQPLEAAAGRLRSRRRGAGVGIERSDLGRRRPGCRSAKARRRSSRRGGSPRRSAASCT